LKTRLYIVAISLFPRRSLEANTWDRGLDSRQRANPN
jgi:hypothetical protein